MTTRREKSKPQRPQINKQLEPLAEPPKPMDDNRQIIYVLGLFIAFMALGMGLVLTDKKKGN